MGTMDRQDTQITPLSKLDESSRSIAVDSRQSGYQAFARK